MLERRYTSTYLNKYTKNNLKTDRGSDSKLLAQYKVTHMYLYANLVNLQNVNICQNIYNTLRNSINDIQTLADCYNNPYVYFIHYKF